MKYLLSALIIVLSFIQVLLLIRCVFVEMKFSVFALSCVYLVLVIAWIQFLKTKD